MAKSKEDNTHSTPEENTPVDFETAIDSSGYGIFNILLLLVAFPAATSTVFETSSMSYILPSAECDLHLTLLDKGTLNAITYAGMITSAVLWGYVADTKGRKKLLVYGFLLDGLGAFGSAFSQSVVQLLIFKYLNGFIICGPFAVLMSYLTELHSRKYRPRIIMLVGTMFSIATVILPVMAVYVLPRQWDFRFLNLDFHSWQVFLALTAIPSIIAGSLLSLFPESPKFLMSQGRNEEALKAFKIVYSLNMRKPKDSFPFKVLVNEIAVKEAANNIKKKVPTVATIEGLKSIEEKEPVARKGLTFREGLLQIRPLFTKPLLSLSLLVYLTNFCILYGQNTVRLWLPQLFASITEYEQISESGTSSMCEILDYSINKTEIMKQTTVKDTCEVIITASSYTNNIIVGLSGFCSYILVSYLVSRIDVKRILSCALIIAAICSISLYWSTSALTTLILSALFVNMGSISGTALLSASANLFPTALRTMVVSLSMMFGRVGSLIGNILFPMFMSAGCISPFLMICGIMLSACILSFFIPKSRKLTLK